MMSSSFQSEAFIHNSKNFPDLSIVLIEIQRRPLGLTAFKFTITYSVLVSVR